MAQVKPRLKNEVWMIVQCLNRAERMDLHSSGAKLMLSPSLYSARQMLCVSVLVHRVGQQCHVIREESSLRWYYFGLADLWSGGCCKVEEWLSVGAW